MDAGDLDAPDQKRLRLDSVNPPPPYNGLPPPHAHAHPSQPQPSRPPVQPSSPTGTRSHHPAHGLPHPSPGYPSQGPPPGPHHYQQHPHPHPHSSTLAPPDLRAYSESTIRPAPSPHQRTDGFSVTLPSLPMNINQDRISDYSRPPPRSAAPEAPSSRSESVDAKVQPGMDHNGHSSPWPPHPDSRANGNSFANGFARVVSPSNHHEQQFHTPPLPQGHQYTPPASAYPSGPGAYMGGSAAYPPGYPKRKQTRATQACNNCRTRKQKCDELRPCSFCKENNFECLYKDIPPPKQDRSMMQLQETMNAMLQMNERLFDKVDSMSTDIAGMNAWRQSVESRLNSGLADLAMRGPHRQEYGNRISMNGRSNSASVPLQRSQSSRVNSVHTEVHSSRSPLMHVTTPKNEDSLVPYDQTPATPAGSVHADRQKKPQVYSDKQKSGLQADHTTPAHRVLQDWTAMETFCDGLPYFEKLKLQGCEKADYPMKLEQSRGLIRVWGVGEGVEVNQGGHSSSPPSDSDTPSPPDTTHLWGKIEPPLSPSTLGAETPQEDHVGGLGPDGRLKLDCDTLERLLDSYMNNIHILQPFLNPSELRRMVKSFSQAYGPEARGSAMYAGTKRKRSGNHFDNHSMAESTTSDTIHKSISNAIVLLVLALGKVCEWKRPLPSPLPDRPSRENTAWGHHYPAQSGFSSDYDDRHKRNIDIMPGMAYFSVATDILGNQNAGNTTMHAQAMLLAGLFSGQYGRVLESWSWINNACRMCLVVIKSELPNLSQSRATLFEQMKKNDNDANGNEPEQVAATPNLKPNPQPVLSEKEKYRRDVTKCVYWACLQLETDILAELSTLAPSEISTYQNDIDYPSGANESSENDASPHSKAMWVYSSQIHLRVLLNEAHNDLYNKKPSKTDPKMKLNVDKQVGNELGKAALTHAGGVNSLRRILPPDLQWKDHHPPSTDINIARLRAKFYGGHYMILRPFLFMAIHHMPVPPEPSSPGWISQTSSPATSGATPSDSTPPGFTGNTVNRGTIIDVSLDCIESAIQSTIAFDRVGGDPNKPYEPFVDTPDQRLIVTNIFGTLHAQFGNMIVLGAVFNSNLGRYLLTLNAETRFTVRNLRLLYERTIKVLRTAGNNSPVLQQDADILENVRRKLHNFDANMPISRKAL